MKEVSSITIYKYDTLPPGKLDLTKSTRIVTISRSRPKKEEEKEIACSWVFSKIKRKGHCFSIFWSCDHSLNYQLQFHHPFAHRHIPLSWKGTQKFVTLFVASNSNYADVVDGADVVGRVTTSWDASILQVLRTRWSTWLTSWNIWWYWSWNWILLCKNRCRLFDDKIVTQLNLQELVFLTIKSGRGQGQGYMERIFSPLRVWAFSSGGVTWHFAARVTSSSFIFSCNTFVLVMVSSNHSSKMPR